MSQVRGKKHLSEYDKRNLLDELNKLRSNLSKYIARQKNLGMKSLNDTQKKYLHWHREKIKRDFNLNKKYINKYGGQTTISVLKVPWDLITYCLKDLYMDPAQLQALDKAIELVSITIDNITPLSIVPVFEQEMDTIEQKNGTERSRRVFNQEASNLFNKMQLHNKIIEVSKSLFDSGHYAQAIFEAFKAVNNLIKIKYHYKSNKNLLNKNLLIN